MSRRDRALRAFAVLGLPAAVAVALYWPTVHFDFVNWDDDQYVTRNPLLHGASTEPAWHWLATPQWGYPIPLTLASYALDVAVAGGEVSPGPMHATNVVLHAGVSALVGAVAWVWGAPLGAATAAGVLFAAHPVCSEPASWVAARKDLLFALLALLAALAHVRQRTGWRGVAWLGALLSKPTAVALPAAFGADDARRHNRRAALVSGAMLLFAGVWTVLVAHMEEQVGALGEAHTRGGFLARVVAGLVVHGRMVVWPAHLLARPIAPQALPATWWVVGGLAGAAWVGWLAWAWWRGRREAVLVALSLASYVPVSGIVGIHREFAAAYVYVPLAFGLAAAGVGAGRLRVRPVVGALLVAAVLAAWVPRSLAERDDWRDGVALWKEVVAAYPDSPQACRNLGNAFLFGRRRQPLQAARVYAWCRSRMGMDTFFLKNEGIALVLAGKPRRAAAALAAYLKENPDDAAARRWLARAQAAAEASGRHR